MTRPLHGQLSYKCKEQWPRGSCLCAMLLPMVPGQARWFSLSSLCGAS